MKHLFTGLWLVLLLCSAAFAGNCAGRFINPVSDVCWKCLFPLYIMGNKVVNGGPDRVSHQSTPCLCPKGPITIPGIPISLWEPVRMVDVTRTPWCFVSMGGKQMGTTGIRGRGDVRQDGPYNQHSFYNVHWYMMPLIIWMELFMDFICLEKGSFDIAYVTELDPTWNDDHKSLIINPEAILFGNPLLQAACAVDCAASTTHLPIDLLPHCAGCQGSMYPYTGTVGAHNGGVQGSLLLVSRIIAKLHRELLLPCTTGKSALCRPHPLLIIKKSQYRTQMTYPLSQSDACQPLGASEFVWQKYREYPVVGEDFGYLIWRKRDCCAL